VGVSEGPTRGAWEGLALGEWIHTRQQESPRTDTNQNWDANNSVWHPRPGGGTGRQSSRLALHSHQAVPVIGIELWWGGLQQTVRQTDRQTGSLSSSVPKAQDRLGHVCFAGPTKGPWGPGARTLPKPSPQGDSVSCALGHRGHTGPEPLGLSMPLFTVPRRRSGTGQDCWVWLPGAGLCWLGTVTSPWGINWPFGSPGVPSLTKQSTWSTPLTSQKT
jgi:hypothetical protein